jgi:folylpolyglutamate synthase
LSGDHQLTNAALSIALCKMWLQRTNKAKEPETIEEIVSMKTIPKSFVDGLESCFWPGRGQKIPLENHNITLYLDGAHTPESMEACRKWFFEKATTSPNLKVLVFNCNTSRDPSTLLSAMATSHFDRVIFSTNETGKSHILEDKRPTSEKHAHLVWQQKNHDTWRSLSNSSEDKCKVVENLPEVLEELYKFEKENQSTHIDVLSTGSLYLVGGWLELLKPEMCDVI